MIDDAEDLDNAGVEMIFDKRRSSGSPHCRECASYGRACRNEHPRWPTPQADPYAMNVDLNDSLLFSQDDYLLESPVIQDSDSFSDDEDDAPPSGADSPIIRDQDEFNDGDGYGDDVDEPMADGDDNDMEVVELDVV